MMPVTNGRYKQKTGGEAQITGKLFKIIFHVTTRSEHALD